MALLNNPLEFKKQSPPTTAMVIGGYFHTCILEPHKLDKYKIVKSTTKNTKAYKEIAGSDICLLEKEADEIQLMREIVLENDLFKDLIQEGNVEYEVPGIAEIFGNQWKGKADIVTDSAFQVIAEDKDGNEQVIDYSDGAVIDLKTTSDMTKFRYSFF